MAGSGIALEASFISEKQFHLFIPDEFGELRDERFALFDPFVFVGRFGYGAGNASGVVLLMKIADERAVNSL